MRASLIPETDYESDLYAWTQDQAALLRARRADAIDWDNLTQEIERLGRRDRRELGSRLAVVLLHLLKWQFQPGRRGSSWQKSIQTQRREIAAILKQRPSLRREVPELMMDAFRYALEDAQEQTVLPGRAFPSCPYAPQQVLHRGYMPEKAGELERSSS
ncbi:MAG TPA: DUF29 domain-containing protein [Geminicoccaceae bacterium]